MKSNSPLFISEKVIQEKVIQSRTYQRINRHRLVCPKWSKEFCFECFGNGINFTIENLVDEGVIEIK